jgi:hypothetical protein
VFCDKKTAIEISQLAFIHSNETLMETRYETYEQLENGDLNWVIPNKLIAFGGPSNKRMETADGGHTVAPGR